MEISLPQDVPSTSNRHLIELKNQVQRLIESHLAPKQPIQVNKITSSCKICCGPHDTQYCMENPEQAFVDYTSLCIDEAGALPSDMVKNPKLNVKSTSPVPSARSYPIVDPQCSSHPSTSINVVKTCSTKTNNSQKSQLPTGMEVGTQQTKEPEKTLKGEFKDLHLNLQVLKVLAHALMYNAILHKYVESLELGKNRSPYRKIKLLTDFYVIDMKKNPETPLLVGRGFLATTNAVIDYRKAKIAVGERITRLIFGVKGIELGQEEAPYWTIIGKRESYKQRPSSNGVGVRTPYYVRKDFLDCHFPREWEIARDVEINPFKDVLVFRRMVEFLGAILINLKRNMWESEDLIRSPINWDKAPKNGDGAWHANIRLIDPDGEEFTKTLQSVPTSRKLSEREDPREIVDLDHFYDT
ncbi:hypothetical protein Tco_0337329 [Tanacetum coccineum]